MSKKKDSGTDLVFAALLAALTAVGAYLRIPMPVAPITLQFFFALCAGLILGPKWGAVSQLLYLLIGLFGMPVFAMGSGFGCALQPGFGFLLGLVPAAGLAGALQKKPIIACLAAWAALYCVGLPYLHFFTKPIPFMTTIKTGFLVFLPADLVKMAVACIICPKVKKALYKK